MERLLFSIDEDRDLGRVPLNELRFLLRTHPRQGTHDATQVVRQWLLGLHFVGSRLNVDLNRNEARFIASGHKTSALILVGTVTEFLANPRFAEDASDEGADYVLTILKDVDADVAGYNCDWHVLATA